MSRTITDAEQNNNIAGKLRTNSKFYLCMSAASRETNKQNHYN